MTSRALAPEAGRFVATTLARRVMSGTLQLALCNAVVRLLPFATIPILTRALSPRDYGVAVLLSTMISFVSVISLAGLDVSYARAYHSARPPSGDAVEHYCWRRALALAAIASLVAAVAWWLLGGAGPSAPTAAPIMAGLLATGIVGSVASTMAQTRARLLGRYRAMAITIACTGVASSGVAIAIVIWWRQDALALLVPVVLTYLLPVLLLGTPSVASLARGSRLPRDAGRALFRIGVAGVVTAPMYWILSSADRWFLQAYRGGDAVGLYSIGYNVAIVGMVVNAAVTSIWLPEASLEFERDRERARTTLGALIVRLTVLMAIVWLAAAAAGGDTIRWLANERFHASAGFVPYIALGVFFYGTAQFSVYGLVLVKQFKWAAIWWTAGGAVSLALNLLLVPSFGGTGAAIAQSASFGFVSVTMFLASQARYRVDVRWRRLLGPLAIIAAAGVVMARPWHERAPLSLLAKLPFGVAVAALVSWIAAPDWCTRALAAVRARGAA